MSEMVERVAKAMFQTDSPTNPQGENLVWGENQTIVSFYMGAARRWIAAYEAYRASLSPQQGSGG